jgi:predicted AAA+ superfamily ATPase
MKTLFELCKPRESVFDETKREDVLNLSDLVEGRIDPATFFEENYLTGGMTILFETAFKRFVNEGATGVVKLTQAMGGGKTHNMLALGLLAGNPEYREKSMGSSSRYKGLGEIRVVAFSGRESDAPLGIWGSIAEQIGKKDLFQQYYTPLSAPGETAWIKLLQGEPLLILLDELAPYLENAKSKMIGNSDLCVVPRQH